MKKCLKYMSSFWGFNTYELLTGIIVLALFQQNGLLIFCIIYAINAMSLSIYNSDTGLINKMGTHSKLTFSLPMSRKIIYDTRMCFVAVAYLVSVLASVIPYGGKYFDYMFSVLSFLFGHIVCGICIRKPNTRIVAGLPVLIVLILLIMCSWIEKLEYLLGQIEASGLSLVVMGIICAAMILIDVFVWLHERRIFINGSSEGNVVKKENTDHDENIKTSFRVVKLKKVVLIAILAVIGYLLFPLFVTGIFVLGYKTAKVEVHNNVNDYLKYHSGPQAEEKYQNKWNMDETIWPEKITPDMTIEDYKMVYYNPLDAQFLGYLTVRYDKENYDKEVKRLKDYESTAYLGYYGVTGFEDYELLAMYADSDQGFVYALTDGKDKIIYVEIIFCNHFMDLKYEKYIPADYLPKGFDAKMDNPYQKKWEKENGLDDLQIF